MAPVAAQEGDTYWYVNGDKYFWNYQPDVFAFRNTNGTPWSSSMDTGCVQFLFHRGMHSDKMNILYFKDECPAERREAVKNEIRNTSGFETAFSVITLFPEKQFDAGAWLVADDLLLVNFDVELLNHRTFNAFKQKYGVEQINFPDSIFPENIITYIFKTDAARQNTIELARAIFTQDSGFVKNVQPNLIYAYEDMSNESINLLASANREISESVAEYYLVHLGEAVKMVVSFKAPPTHAQLKVYDLFGREIASYGLTGLKSQITIPLADFASGIYFACIEDKEGKAVGVERFLKQ